MQPTQGHGAVARPLGRAPKRSVMSPPLRSGYRPVVLTIAVTIFTALSTLAQSRPDKDYLVYVVSESADQIALIRFGRSRNGT